MRKEPTIPKPIFSVFFAWFSPRKVSFFHQVRYLSRFVISNSISFVSEIYCYLLQIRNEYYELFKLKPDITEYVTTELIKKIEKTQLTVQSYITPEKPERSTP